MPEQLTLVWAREFKRDVRRALRRGKDLDKLKDFLGYLVRGETLPASYQDHPLKGNWVGYRDAHLEGDWIVIYRIEGSELKLARTGTHADLFKQ